MNYIGANRLKIAHYFDGLKSKVDICVENFIAAHHQDKEQETKINQVRTGWLKEIDECEKFNLAVLEEREDKHLELDDEALFKKFIFEFEVSEGKELTDLRLIAIDEYLSPGKVECFQTMAKVVGKQIYVEDFQKNSLAKLFLNIETNEFDVNKTF
jgi:hypothetical protein